MTRRKLSALFLLALSGSYLWLFVSIWLAGAVKVAEPNLAIRLLETIMSAGIFGFAVYNLIKEVK